MTWQHGFLWSVTSWPLPVITSKRNNANKDSALPTQVPGNASTSHPCCLPTLHWPVTTNKATTETSERANLRTKRLHFEQSIVTQNTVLGCLSITEEGLGMTQGPVGSVFTRTLMLQYVLFHVDSFSLYFSSFTSQCPLPMPQCHPRDCWDVTPRGLFILLWLATHGWLKARCERN